MTHPFPVPPIEPFERLQASDGLLIDAKRWSKAHDYHRLRQNVTYQCLNQPGIACGLGVRHIPAPHHAEAKYRDGRWVQIQPGIAIDVAGNVIVVPKSYDFPIDLEVAKNEPITVYLIVSYIDPNELRNTGQKDVVQETYRFDQKNSTPESLEIELCRILLQPKQTTITAPRDVFFPGYNNLDLRYRRPVEARPQAIIRIAQVNHGDSECDRNFFNLSYLMQSVEPLYPFLRGCEDIGQATLQENIQEYDLLYLTGQQALSINHPELESLRSYLNTGGVLMVDAPANATELVESTQALAQQLQYSLKPLEESRRHPLRTRPFLFAALPTLNKQVVRILIGGGIILVIGDLAAAWGLDSELSFPRLLIRTAQELGVNILHYAWKRRQLIGLQQEDSLAQW